MNLVIYFEDQFAYKKIDNKDRQCASQDADLRLK